jgi:hypothetical protein
MDINNVVENEGSSRQLMIGLGAFEVIAVNPDGKTINKIYKRGEDAEVKEPVYEGEKAYRIDFYLRENAAKENPLITKMAFFVSNDDVETKDGDKKLYTNHYLQEFYFPTADFKESFKAFNDSKDEDWKRFSEDGLRVAKKGELGLLKFIAALFNMNLRKNKLEFDNFKRITQGNLAELKELMASAEEKGKLVYCLCGVKDGKYQDVWNKAFLPYGYSAKQEERFYKLAGGEFDNFKSEYERGPLKPYSSGEPAGVEEDDIDNNPLFTDEEKAKIKAEEANKPAPKRAW